MALGTIMPDPKFTGFDSNGDPLNGGKLYTYAAGTETALATYTSSALTVANANPVVLDAAGRATVFLSAATYKFVLKTSADVTVWTVDGVAASSPFEANLDVPGTAGEALTAGNVVYLSTGAGGTTAGRWYKADADAAATSSTANVIGMVPAAIAAADEGSIRLQGRIEDLSGLSVGAAYYISATAGAITNIAPANARFVGAADSATSLVMMPTQNGGVGIFSALTVTGTVTLTTLTASQAVFTNSSKELVSVATNGTGNVVLTTSPSLVTPALGTPTAGTLTNCTGFPAGSLAGLGSNVATFLATPSSANLIAAVTDETGTGSLVFSASPTFTGTITASVANFSGAVSTGILTVSTVSSGAAIASLTDADGGYVAFASGSAVFGAKANGANSRGVLIRSLSSGSAVDAITIAAAGGATFVGDVTLAATKRVYLDGGGNTYIVESAGDITDVVCGGVTAVSVFSGGLMMGSLAGRSGTAGTATIHLFNGTAPAGTLTNGISLYSSGGEAFALNAAGTETRLTLAVNAVSPTSPNRTLTTVIGGTTYYIHAKTTND